MIIRRTAGMLLALVLAMAAGARVFHLGDRVVWFDEAVSLLVARAPSVGAAFVAARDEGHGPLFNLVLHYWIRMVPGEVGARWLSVILGVAAVGGVWAIGNRMAGAGAGLFSAFLLAMCPLHVWYSQEIRMYALQVLLIGCGVDRLLRRSRLGAASAVVGTMLALNLHALHGYYADENEWVKSPLRTVAWSIAHHARPGDVVIHSTQFNYRPFQFYMNDALPQGLLVQADNRPGLFGIIGDARVPADAMQSRRIWLVVTPDFLQPGLHQRVVEWMNAHHHLVQLIHNSKTLYVGLYERGDAPLILLPAEIAFGCQGLIVAMAEARSPEVIGECGASAGCRG